MQLNPYGEDPVLLAVELANRPPDSLEDLVKRCGAAGVVLDMPIEDDDLATARDLVERWCAIVDAPAGGERAALVNRLLAEASAYPRLSNHVGDGCQPHYRDDEVSLGTVLRALISVGTALHLTGRGMSRLGRCAAEGCSLIYADVSRGGRQRYCAPACANRDAVRRHRATRRA